MEKGSFTQTQDSGKSLPPHWMQALQRKFSMMYLEKFSRFFPDQETINDWCATWGEGLAGVTGEEIKYGLEIVSRNHPWPPTMGEFRACCKAAPKPILPKLEAPRHGKSPHAEACMAKIRGMLANPKPEGVWGKKQVLDRAAIGHRVSVAALELARISRQPGEDLEEDDA